MSLRSFFKISSPLGRTEQTNHLLELAGQIKQMLQYAKDLTSSCAESRKQVSRLNGIGEEGRLLLDKLKADLKSHQVPIADISKLSSEFEILFESVKSETEGATAAFDDFFQATSDLDQSVTKTTDILKSILKTF